MAIYKIQNCSSLKYLDSNITQLSDFNSTNNERPSVTVENSSSSISQKWVIDRISGTTYIRSCIDKNMCLSRFENAVTHQCAMSLEKCYSSFRSSFSPEVQLIAVSLTDSTYRIKLYNSNMYLIELNTGAVSWGSLDINNQKQIWKLTSSSATTNYTLDVYQIMNQKYSGYNGEMWDGCEAAAFSNVGAFYHKGYYTYSEMKSEGFVNGTNQDNGNTGAVDDYGMVKYMKITGTYSSMNYSNIKSELDAERPVLIRMGKTNSDSKHTVVVYGYKNSCSSMSDLLVLDSANTHNALDDVGLFFTLSESMQHNSQKDMIINYRTTNEK